jgi:hypothetical protein
MKRGAKELKEAKLAEKRPSFDVVDDTILVNGAVMEGGGQILRNCVALAAILEKRLQVFAIRANRPRGGGTLFIVCQPRLLKRVSTFFLILHL